MTVDRGDGNESVGDLAEQEMAEKTKILGNEEQSRELWDVPTETSGKLAEQQDAEQAGDRE